MPGLLKPTAKCPGCGDPLLMLVDTSNAARVVREFFHERRPGSTRRRRKCVKVYRDHDQAQRERRALEVRAA